MDFEFFSRLCDLGISAHNLCLTGGVKIVADEPAKQN